MYNTSLNTHTSICNLLQAIQEAPLYHKLFLTACALQMRSNGKEFVNFLDVAGRFRNMCRFLGFSEEDIPTKREILVIIKQLEQQQILACSETDFHCLNEKNLEIFLEISTEDIQFATKDDGNLFNVSLCSESNPHFLFFSFHTL
jgi:hypothetical protein